MPLGFPRRRTVSSVAEITGTQAESQVVSRGEPKGRGRGVRVHQTRRRDARYCRSYRTTVVSVGVVVMKVTVVVVAVYPIVPCVSREGHTREIDMSVPDSV